MDALRNVFPFLIFTLNIGVPSIRATFPMDCDYLQNLIVGEKYYIYSKGYPDKYLPSTKCFWYGISPPGTNIIISCEEINLPNTPNCQGDKLKIFISGNRDLADARNYCGFGTISLSTLKNQIAIELFSTFDSIGGRFLCTLTAMYSFTNENISSNLPKITTCDCGLKSGTRIVGGITTQINEYPSMAGLTSAQNPEIICGANIITDRYLLSAAHCMGVIPLKTMGILVGDWNISTGADTSASVIYKAKNIYLHPKYDAQKQINDIAIVQTQSRILFSLKVNPICLPFKYSDFDFSGQNATLLGWGQLFFSGPRPDTLQKVNVDVVTNTYCQEKLPANNISSSQICTFRVGKDACQSDSGGPLLWNDLTSDRWHQIGVVSYGYACATNRPGVQSRITPYLSWIISKTNDAEYCFK